MKKTVLTFGLISGAVMLLAMLVSMQFHQELQDRDAGLLVGYATMVIALSSIFFAVRSYRDRELGGTITFGKAFQLGLLISLVAGVLYAIGWMVYSAIAMPDFMEKYAQSTLEHLKKSGASAQEIAEETKSMNQWKELYKNPFIKFVLTFLEMAPVGLIISLISAFALRTKVNATQQPQAAEVAR